MIKQKLKRFEDSLNKIKDEELIKLFDEIDSQTQKGQITVEQYFSKINNENNKRRLNKVSTTRRV